MFRFENPDMFYWLIALLFIVLLFHYGMYVQKKRLRTFGNPNLLASLMPNVSSVRPYVKFYLLIIVLVLLVFALARPQMGTKIEDSKTNGVEVMFVLDVSKSMLSQDVTPSRLDNAKMMLSKLIDKMSEDKVGMVVFAGDAFVQLPLTTDNVSAKMFLSTINTNTVPRPGTAIGAAIELATKCFPESESGVGRSIIVITDGENHEDDAVKAVPPAPRILLVCVILSPPCSSIVTTMLEVITNTFIFTAPYAFPRRISVSSTRFTSAPHPMSFSPIFRNICRSLPAVSFVNNMSAFFLLS